MPPEAFDDEAAGHEDLHRLLDKPDPAPTGSDSRTVELSFDVDVLVPPDTPLQRGEDPAATDFVRAIREFEERGLNAHLANRGPGADGIREHAKTRAARTAKTVVVYEEERDAATWHEPG